MPGPLGPERTVFVVDDDTWIHAMLRMALEDEGYRVVTASNGQEALAQLDQHQPNVIVLDWMMPTMNGLSFHHELCRRGLRPGIPIVVLTADGNAHGKAEQIGAEGYLRKPFDLDQLLDQVARLIQASPS
jgi:CheY-like chemotaxis protein